MSSRPALPTELVPGQAPKLQRNAVLKKKMENVTMINDQTSCKVAHSHNPRTQEQKASPHYIMRPHLKNKRDDKLGPMQ